MADYKQDAVYWLSPVGGFDDFGMPISDCIIDGATTSGPWGIMTPSSHRMHGRGLGLGKGQRYEKQDDGKWLKVEG